MPLLDCDMFLWFVIGSKLHVFVPNLEDVAECVGRYRAVDVQVDVGHITLHDCRRRKRTQKEREGERKRRGMRAHEKGW